MGQIKAYMDFKGGLNDTSSPEDLKNNELLVADNIDLSERGGFTTRKGVVKLNSTSFGGDVTQAFEWLTANQSKIIAVIAKNVYEIKEDGSRILKQAIQRDFISYIVVQNKLYFTDGTQMYVWGDFDFFTTDGTQMVLSGEIVKNSPASSGGGIENHFYKAKAAGEVNLSTANYADTSKWEDVTEIANIISNVIRPVKPHDSSAKEKVTLTIKQKAERKGNIIINIGGIRKEISTAGEKEVISLKITAKPTKTENVTIILDGKVKFVNAYANEEINTLAERIRAFPFEGYKNSGTGDTIIFTAEVEGEKGNHYFGGGETGVTGTMTVTTTGSGDDEEGIATKIRATAFTGWTLTGTGKTVIFEAVKAEQKEDFIFDSNDTGIVAEYEIVTQGKENDCNLEPIKKCTMFIQHPKSLRVFASGNPDDPTALYISEYNHMEYFKELNKIYPRNSEGAVTGLTTLYQDIMVSYNNSWWHFRGIDPEEDAIWEQLPIPYGCVSHNSIAVTPFSFTFLGAKGIYTISASIINQEVVMVQSKEMIRNITQGKVEKTIESITHPSKAEGIFYNNKYMLAYCDDNTGINNKVLVFDWDIKTFSKYTGWNVNSFIQRANGDLLFASKNFILKTGEGYSDIDTVTGEKKAIHLYVETKYFNLGLPIHSKFLKFLYLMFKQHKKTESFINTFVKCDYKTIQLSMIDLAESLIYGRAWGKVWGYTDYLQKFAEIKAIATRFQLIFESNRIEDEVTIYGIGFDFKPLKPKGKKINRGGGYF